MKRNCIYMKGMMFLCGASLFFAGCSQDTGNSGTAAPADTAEATGTAHSAGSTDHEEMQTGGSNKMMNLMHENMNKMHGMKMSGDPDHDFAKMMSTHHEGAITMSEEELGSGKDGTLKQMATKTISSSRKDIEEFQKFLSSHQPAAGDTAMSMKMMGPMGDMMSGMNHDMKGTTDHHFASMMSMHHQAGIDMAKVYLQQGKASEIKRIAQKIIDEQQMDKQKLQDWLQQNPQQ